MQRHIQEQAADFEFCPEPTHTCAALCRFSHTNNATGYQLVGASCYVL